jgi:hypothetical protein
LNHLDQFRSKTVVCVVNPTSILNRRPARSSVDREKRHLHNSLIVVRHDSQELMGGIARRRPCGREVSPNFDAHDIRILRRRSHDDRLSLRPCRCGPLNVSTSRFDYSDTPCGVATASSQGVLEPCLAVCRLAGDRTTNQHDKPMGTMSTHWNLLGPLGASAFSDRK